VISSLSNPRVKQVVKWRKGRARRADGVLIAEGFREVGRAMEAGLAPVELFIDASCDMQLVAQSIGHELPKSITMRVTGEVLRKMTYHSEPEGLIGVFKSPDLSVERLSFSEKPWVLVAVGMEKPGNFGAVVRTAAAAGCDAVIGVGPSIDPFNPNAIRNSTAAVFSTPIALFDTDQAAIGWLRSNELKIAAAVVGGNVDCFAADLTGPLALVIGPEHEGLNSDWQASADLRLHIPMQTDTVVDSLNASTAGAVLLYETRRQRGLP
jgi:TrmH family RNA methyltransferase